MRLSWIATEVRAAGIAAVDNGPTMSDRLSQAARLTGRQSDILARLVDGQAVGAIAGDLFLSRSTVRNHLSAIYRKFRVHSQVELLRALAGQTERLSR